MNWRRIVLDEGHQIRNPTAKISVAVSHLRAKSRWVLTGTPIINTVQDLYPMLRFLKITGGLERRDIFNSTLTRPIKAGNHHSEVLLQTVMQSMCLRRKKEMKFIDLRLPILKEYVHRIPFRADEREKYDAVW